MSLVDLKLEVIGPAANAKPVATRECSELLHAELFKACTARNLGFRGGVIKYGALCGVG